MGCNPGNCCDMHAHGNHVSSRHNAHARKTLSLHEWDNLCYGYGMNCLNACERKVVPNDMAHSHMYTVHSNNYYNARVDVHFPLQVENCNKASADHVQNVVAYRPRQFYAILFQSGS